MIGWRQVCWLTLIAGCLTRPAAADAHLFYNESGWVHVAHSRDYYFYNGADATYDGGGSYPWRDACRAAQLDWHGTMNGSLRFYSSSHDASTLHCLDERYGDTGWAGRATHPGFDAYLCAHCGHAHLGMNESYNSMYHLPSGKQAVACHEIGHPVGLAHSTDATDCMRTPWTAQYPTIGGAHRDQLRAQWNSTGH